MNTATELSRPGLSPTVPMPRMRGDALASLPVEDTSSDGASCVNPRMSLAPELASDCAVTAEMAAGTLARSCERPCAVTTMSSFVSSVAEVGAGVAGGAVCAIDGEAIPSASADAAQVYSRRLSTALSPKRPGASLRPRTGLSKIDDAALDLSRQSHLLLRANHVALRQHFRFGQNPFFENRINRAAMQRDRQRSIAVEPREAFAVEGSIAPHRLQHPRALDVEACIMFVGHADATVQLDHLAADQMQRVARHGLG